MKHKNEHPMHNRKKYRWLLLCAIILILFFLIPFLLVGNRIETWANNFIQSASNQPGLTAIVLSLLLASDILLPVPANEANTAAGFFLGFTGGLAISLIGRMIGCIIGFWLGMKFGRPIAQRLAGANELKRLEKMGQRFGDWLIIILRPVPMLAEASVLFAGMSKMSVSKFLLLTSISNLGVSAVFSAVGAFSATVNSFLLAFAACVIISLTTMFISKKRDKIPRLKEEVSMVGEQTNNKWKGIKGIIGSWFLSSPFVRRLEMLFVGNYRSAFLTEISHLVKGNEVILDVGAGSGYFSLLIAEKLKNGKVICLDLSEEMLNTLERKAEKKGLKDKIQILKADASSTGLKEESVDLAVSNFVLHELSHTEAILSEIKRVMKTGGWIIITDFRKDTWIGRRIDSGHKESVHGPFTAGELDKLFNKIGFKNVKVKQIRNFILGVGKK